MKHLKFRAYKPVHGDDDLPVMTRPFTLGNLQDKEDFEFTNGMYSSWDEFGLEHKDCVVMQFTGLQDSNNKDIYEGDIVNNEKGNHIVKLINGCWMFEKSHRSYVNAHWYKSEFAVIGNIKENPELWSMQNEKY
jgi:hypothetical protein